MPRISERAQIIQSLELLAVYQELFPDADSHVNNNDAAELLEHINASRYFAPRIQNPKNRYWLEEGLWKLDGKGFRQQMRVSRSSFRFILRRIIGHPIFTNNSPNEQLPIQQQLCIALWRFGRYGNGASLIDAARLFAISEGTVFKVTERVIVACKTNT